MFEKIVLKRSIDGPALSVGELAEALLFYQNVHLILDYGSTKGFFQTIGAPTFLSLLSRSNVHATYCKEKLGTRTHDTGPIKTHNFIAFTYAGSETKGNAKNLKTTIRHILEDLQYKKRDIKNYSSKFVSLVASKKLQSNHFIKGGILDSAWEDLYDDDYVFEAVRRSLISITQNPLLPNDLKLHIIHEKPNFKIISNIDFEALNVAHKKLDPLGRKITEASLVNNLLEAKGDIILGSHYGGELYTSNLSSDLIQLRYKNILKRINIDKEQIKNFYETVIEDGRNFKDIVNSGERTFDDFLKLLDKAEKFKEWISGVNPDEKLIKSYLEEVSKKGWGENLPVKVLRYVVTTAIGAVEPLTGAASATDTFLIDKIIKGWRPNHFVEGKIRPFLEESS